MDTQIVDIGEVTPDPANVRTHSEENLQAIKGSLLRFGQQKPIVVSEDGWVIAGNGTLAAALALGWDQISVVKTKLHGSEATAYAIADNRTSDLADWDVDSLLLQMDALNVEDPDLAVCTGWTPEALVALLEVDSVDAGTPAQYSRKIVTPIYEPKGEQPNVSELYDEVRANELLADIQAADLPDDVRAFLEAAAERHTSFHFGRIADYYAHAPPEVQQLMEQSALVIIDFEQAIEQGFVKLSKAMLEQVELESPESENPPYAR